MSNLTVKERNKVLVIDSRLVALELGVNHGDWFKNVLLKYQQEIEEDFGVIGFENGKPLKASKGGRPERFAWLTEEQATVLMTYSRNTEKVRRCKRQLVKAFTEAKKVIKEVIPAQSQELERLKLELELAKTQERLLATTNTIASLHGSETLALMMGKPDAIVTRTERVETLVEVDNRGRAIASFNGVGITFLAKRYGFGKNTKACRYWLETVGVTEEQWLTEPTLVKTQKLPRELLPWLDRTWANKKGVRQRLLGE